MMVLRVEVLVFVFVFLEVFIEVGDERFGNVCHSSKLPAIKVVAYFSPFDSEEMCRFVHLVRLLCGCEFSYILRRIKAVKYIT